MAFEETQTPLGKDGRTSAAARLATAGRFVITLDTGFMLQAGRDDVSVIEGCPRDYFSQVSLGENRYWFGSQHGVVDLVEIDEEASTCRVEQTTRTSSDAEDLGQVEWMVGSRAGEPFELFTLSRVGRFDRYDGSSWTHLATFALHPNSGGDTDDGGLVRLGPGRVLVSVGTNEVMLWQQGQELRRSTVPLSFSGARGGFRSGDVA